MEVSTLDVVDKDLDTVTIPIFEKAILDYSDDLRVTGFVRHSDSPPIDSTMLADDHWPSSGDQFGSPTRDAL